jgi:hypothetical protein
MEIFLFTTASRQELKKYADYDADHSPPPSDESKNARSFTYTPIRLRGVVLSEEM